MSFVEISEAYNNHAKSTPRRRLKHRFDVMFMCGNEHQLTYDMKRNEGHLITPYKVCLSKIGNITRHWFIEVFESMQR